jgi:hypothetical protein
MKKALCIIVLFAVCQTAHADTIDIWHVYRNKIKIFDSVWAKAPLIRLTDLKPDEFIGIALHHCAMSTEPVWRSIELWTADRKRLWKRYTAEMDEDRTFYFPSEDLLKYWNENPRGQLVLTFKERLYRELEVHDSLVVLSQ